MDRYFNEILVEEGHIKPLRGSRKVAYLVVGIVYAKPRFPDTGLLSLSSRQLMNFGLSYVSLTVLKCLLVPMALLTTNLWTAEDIPLNFH